MQGTLIRGGKAFAVLLALLLLSARAEDPMDERIRNQNRPEAPELDGASGWINSEKPLKMADLRGKVVLLDFWTFG